MLKTLLHIPKIDFLGRWMDRAVEWGSSSTFQWNFFRDGLNNYYIVKMLHVCAIELPLNILVVAVQVL